MRMRVLGCSGGSAPGRHLSGYLLDDVFAVDAGALTTGLDLESQKRVEAVAVTHAHLDHCWSFPLFLANRFSPGSGTCRFYADAETMAAIRASLFNDKVWPDLTVSNYRGIPLVEHHVLPLRTPVSILGRYEVTAVPVHHTVPSVALLVRRGDRSLLVCGDTGPTEEVWRIVDSAKDLRGVVLECSFPDAEGDLARITGHLTPSLFAKEIAKASRDVPVFATHIKPEHRTRVVEELRALGLKRVRILEDGQAIDF